MQSLSGDKNNDKQALYAKPDNNRKSRRNKMSLSFQSQ